MTPAQEAAFRNVVAMLRMTYGDLSIAGHNQYSSKACPSFDVREKFADLL